MTFIPNCSDYFVSYRFAPTEWFFNYQETYTLIEFYIGTTLQLFIPFSLLIFLNIAIIYSIKSHNVPTHNRPVQTTIIIHINEDIKKRKHKVVISSPDQPTNAFPPVITKKTSSGKLGKYIIIIMQ